MSADALLGIDEALGVMRTDPRYADLVRDAYLDRDVREAAERFRASAEFVEVRGMVPDWRGLQVLDLGAGNGIASYAFASLGVARVYCVEPSLSKEVGCRAIRRLTEGLPVLTIAACGEEIPLPEGTVDVVYTRQVLHHVSFLPEFLRECARVLKKGGTLIACREHVVRDQRELGTFLANHAMHQLAGGENALEMERYVGAIRAAGLELRKVLGPWESVINAFPAVRSDRELKELPAAILRRQFGGAGLWLGSVPAVGGLVRAYLTWRSAPGRMYSFWAAKA